MEVTEWRVLDDGQLALAVQLGGGMTWHGLLPPPALPPLAARRHGTPGKLSGEPESALESQGACSCAGHAVAGGWAGRRAVCMG